VDRRSGGRHVHARRRQLVLLKRYLIEAVRGALVADRERVIAQDRVGASMHRDNARDSLARLGRDIMPTHRVGPIVVAPLGDVVATVW
jgi:hypothetical protein